MSVFTKLKNIFYDDVEEEKSSEKVKEKEKEIKPITEEIKLPEEVRKVKDEVIEEAKTDSTFSERDLFRSERTFNFTEFDDEDDAPVSSRQNALDLEKRSSRTEILYTKSVQTPRTFKLSPVISPIYGILDKDYSKEEVEERKDVIKESEHKKVDYDLVRKKAYGTLEDDLEDTMIKTPKDIKKSVDNIEGEMDKLNEKTAKIEDLISRIENTDTNVTIGDLEDKVKEETYDESNEEDIDDKTISDDTLEHDLFNLIDSMYDDKEE